MSYAILYLPEAVYVNNATPTRPAQYFNTESNAKAFMECNICVKESFQRPYVHFISPEELYRKENLIPLYHLEVVEV